MLLASRKIMKRNISETPERWVILKLPNDYYKVIKDNMLVKLIGYTENDEPIFKQIKENEKRISQNV